MSASAEAEKVAVVLSGAAARGAFQAGALASLVPALEAEGLTPTIWLGTSAGSINAVLWGSVAHLHAKEAAQQVVDVWQRMNDDNVYEPLLLSLPLTGLQYLRGAACDRGSGTTSVLDTAPLARTAHEVLDPGQLEANIAAGLLDAVGVVATRMPADSETAVAGAASGRSVLFLHEHEKGSYEGDPARALDVVRGPLDARHVLASSAIPVAFPPVRVESPARAAGWYVDGGVRLNTPLDPAVMLGATKIVVVSATTTRYGEPPPPGAPGRMPDIADAAAQVLHAALADRTAEDLRALLRMNALVAQAPGLRRTDRRDGGRRGRYRRIEVITVSPKAGAMGHLAARIFADKTRGLGRLTELDSWLLGRTLRGAGDSVGRRELLSYLFFDEDYFAESIRLGADTAAEAWAEGWKS